MKAPQYERAIVRIDEVDIPNRVAHVVDKTNSTFQAGFRDVDTAFQIPKQGEKWIVARQGYQWVLERRWESSTELEGLTKLTGGDVRIRVPGTLYINTNPIGVMTWEQLVADGAIQCFVLEKAALSERSIQVFRVSSGVILNPASYTLTDTNDDVMPNVTYATKRVVKINPAPGAGTLTFYYQKNAT